MPFDSRPYQLNNDEELPPGFAPAPMGGMYPGEPAGGTGPNDTLAAVGMTGVPASEIWQTYMANRQLALQAYQPLMKPLMQVPERSVGQVIGDILTGGATADNRRKYADTYNKGLWQYNVGLQRQADELAKEMTQIQVQKQQASTKMQAAEFQQNMALQRHELNLLKFKESQQQHDYQNWQRDNLMGQKLSVPPTADQTAQGVARGQSWEPGKGWSGGSRVAPYRPPSANAPLGELSSQAGPEGGPSGDSAALAGLQGPESLEAARARKKQAMAASGLQAKPMEGEDRKVISGILRLRALMKRSQEEFTPAERDKYVGVLRNPTERAKQFFQGDEKFQKFQALVGQMQTQKFELAGAALTAGEQAVLDKFLPSGAEVGGAQEFDNKVNEFYKSSLDQARQRMKLGQGRGAVAEELAAESDTISPTPSSPSAPTGAKTRTLSSGKVIYEE